MARARSGPRPFYVAGEDPPAKQRILKAALELFVRDGICETSIRDIAEAAGFTNPALFKHFAGKDALVEYLFERCYLELFRVVRSAVGGGGSFAERQRALIEEYLQALDRDPDSVIFVADWLRPLWPRMPAELRRHSILGQIRGHLAGGRSEGAVTAEVDLDLLTAACVGMMQQFARMRYFGEFRQDTRRLADSLNRLLTRLVGA